LNCNISSIGIKAAKIKKEPKLTQYDAAEVGI